ncbi:phage integrase N-terminal SAM-like domain-containing protein, partial [Bacillus sp. JJ664]
MALINQLKQNSKDVILQFASHLNSKGRKESTIKRYCYDLEDCFRYFRKKEIGLDTLTISHFNEYFQYLITDRNYNEKTMHRIYVVLNQFYKFLQINDPTIQNMI